MVTYYPFRQTNPNVLFSFSPTLDGNVYNITVFWLVSPQSWYIIIKDQFGNIVVIKRLTGSQALQPISNIAWSNGIVTVTTQNPLIFPLASIAPLTLYNCTPNGYNGGPNQCVISGPNTFTFPLATNPGNVTALGGFALDVNLVWGYFFTNTLVYRPTTGNFEVGP